MCIRGLDAQGWRLPPVSVGWLLMLLCALEALAKVPGEADSGVAQGTCLRGGGGAACAFT
jgi:hypothetical protein